MRAAILARHQRAPAKIVVAVPIASAETCKEFSDLVDEIICAQTPEPFTRSARGTAISRRRATMRCVRSPDEKHKPKFRGRFAQRFDSVPG